MGSKRVSRKKRRVYGPADRETRANKIMSVSRMVDGEQSQALAATVGSLDFDEENLRYKKVPGVHRVFLLDPRLTNRHFKRGFEQGFNFARALQRMKDKSREQDDTVDVALGDVVIRDRKHVLGTIESEQLQEETIAIKRQLGDEGLKGMRGTRALRSAHHMIYLARLEIPLPAAQQEDFSATLEASLAVHGLLSLTVGPMQVSQHAFR